MSVTLVRVSVDGLHVLIYPAEDVAGEWIAHVLDSDAMTQGRSIDHAIEMALEAHGMISPKRKAPREEWDKWYEREPEYCHAACGHFTHNESCIYCFAHCSRCDERNLDFDIDHA